MIYKNTVTAEFISRPNRFVARVMLYGKEETVHVKNTGRCRELLVPGRRVVLTPGSGAGRKTDYDLVAVEKPGLGWVNIDSQAPNAVVREYLEKRRKPFGDVVHIGPEYSYGNSRVDFYMVRKGKEEILLEVKGCTLEIDGVGYFPDAPTQRGVKHLRELAAAVSRGYECFIAFVIAMPGVFEVRPNSVTDPVFAEAFDKARQAGVKVLFLPCSVSPDSLKIKE